MKRSTIVLLSALGAVAVLIVVGLFVVRMSMG
jgi:hypothetical protein